MDADVNDVPQPSSLCKYTCVLFPFSPVNFRPPISLSTKMCNVSFLLYDLSYKHSNLVSSYCCSMIYSADAWLLVQSFMDVQFQNGQVTYVAGEGITASGIFPLFGRLLQAHGKCPGETRVSFSFKVSIFINMVTVDHLILLRSVPNYFICLSYSTPYHLKSKQGTRFTPMFQWPDNSLSFGVAQALAWKRSVLMVRPSVQVRYVCTCSESIGV
jgi:hypothetical protein